MMSQLPLQEERSSGRKTNYQSHQVSFIKLRHSEYGRSPGLIKKVYREIFD